MTNKIKIAFVCGLIIIAIAVYMLYTKNDSKELKQSLETASSTITALTQEAKQASTSTKTTQISSSTTIKDRAWSVLQQYLALAKAHDIAGVSALSYQISDSCKKASTDASMKKDCEGKMDTVYNIGSGFKENYFTNVWSDNKQIVLATNWSVSTEGDFATRMRAVIYFIVDPSGAIKVLSFKPAQGTFISKYDKDASGNPVKISDKELNDRLIKFTDDKDQDGIEDYIETCSGISDIPTCVKTDPTKRDSNGNGFWDGVEAMFYK